MKDLNLDKKPIAAVAFLYNKVTNSVFLHKRDSNAPINPNKWAFFGGLAELDETPEETVLRELEEEIGLVVSKNELRKLDGYYNDELKTIRHVFYIEHDMPKDKLTLTEGEDMDWIPLDKVFQYDLSSKTIRDLHTFLELIADTK